MVVLGVLGVGVLWCNCVGVLGVGLFFVCCCEVVCVCAWSTKHQHPSPHPHHQGGPLELQCVGLHYTDNLLVRFRVFGDASRETVVKANFRLQSVLSATLETSSPPSPSSSSSPTSFSSSSSAEDAAFASSLDLSSTTKLPIVPMLNINGTKGTLTNTNTLTSATDALTISDATLANPTPTLSPVPFPYPLGTQGCGFLWSVTPSFTRYGVCTVEVALSLNGGADYHVFQKNSSLSVESPKFLRVYPSVAPVGGGTVLTFRCVGVCLRVCLYVYLCA